MRRRIDLAWAISAVVAIAVGGTAIATLVGAGDGRGPAVAAGLVTALAGAIAAFCCELARGRSVDTVGRAWRWLALGAAAFSVSGLLRLLAALGATRPEHPMLADAPQAVGLVLLVAASLDLQPRDVRWAARRVLLDGLLVSSALAFLGWISVLGHGAALDGWSVLGATTLLAFPVLDLVYCTAITTRRAVHAATPAASDETNAPALLAVGACLFASHLFDLLGAIGDASSFATSGLCAAAGMLALALAAATSDTDPTDRTLREGAVRHPGRIEAERAELAIARRSVSSVLLPTSATVIGLIGGAVASARHRMPLSSLGLLAVLGAFVIARRILVMVDNSALIAALDRRVANRAAAADEREQYYRTLVQNASDALAVIDPHGRIVHASGNVRSVLGWSASDLEGLRLLRVIHPDERRMVLDAARSIMADPGHTHLVECRIVGKDGGTRVVESTIANLVADPLIGGLVCTSRDISERQALEREREVATLTDHLTGLANRTMLLRQLDEAIAVARGRGRIVGLVFLDLDGFKKVNDTLGHLAGDAVLREVSDRIARAVRGNDLPARLGGDEFAVLLYDLEDPSHLGTVTGRLTHALAEPIDVEGRRIHVRASVGAALTGQHAETGSELLRNADLAMYSGKSRGKGRIEHFHPELLVAMRERTELEAELRRAMEGQELELYFQPLVDLRTERIRSLEALIRWHHPTRGMLMPGAFVPLAEESDLVIELDRWVLRAACDALARLAGSAAGAGINIAANVSGRHLIGGELVNDIAGSLLETSVDAGRLTLEVTETVAFEETTEVVTTLQRLRKLGCKIAIDDFGTGSSSLSKLSRLPVDQLKLDGSFIREITTSTPAPAVIAAIVEMAKTLELDLVAEGIETPGQLHEVTQLGITIGQGFLLSRPAPITEIEALLSTRTEVQI